MDQQFPVHLSPSLFSQPRNSPSVVSSASNSATTSTNTTPRDSMIATGSTASFASIAPQPSSTLGMPSHAPYFSPSLYSNAASPSLSTNSQAGLGLNGRSMHQITKTKLAPFNPNNGLVPSVPSRDWRSGPQQMLNQTSYASSPTQESPTHVVGSQGRRGILPSAPGRPAVSTSTTISSGKNAPIPAKDANGKFPCPHCNKTYLHAKHLKRHLLRHTGDRPYSCGLCHDTFCRSDILKRHFQKCSIRRGNPDNLNHLSSNASVKKSHPKKTNKIEPDSPTIQSPTEGYDGLENGSFPSSFEGLPRGNHPSLPRDSRGNLPPASAVENMSLVSPTQGLNGFGGVNPTYLSSNFLNNSNQPFSERQRPSLNKHPSSSAENTATLLSSINGSGIHNANGLNGAPIHNGMNSAVNGIESTTLPQPFGTNSSFNLAGDPSNDWFMDNSYGWQKNYNG